MGHSHDERKFSWGKASMVATSIALGLLLLSGLRGIGDAREAADGLLGALQIVSVPGALVLVILGPYLVVRSGEEWVEKRQSDASFRAESAQVPRLSLLRGSDAFAVPDELLRSTQQIGQMAPHELLRAGMGAAAESERG